MLLSKLAAVAIAATVAVTMAACGNSSKASSSASPQTSSAAGGSTAARSAALSTGSPIPSSPAASSTGTSSRHSSSGGPSFVNGGAALANTGNLIAVLEAVNPKIGTNKDDLVAKSKALCAHIRANESATQLAADAAKGFTNGSWVPSDSEGVAIVGTVRAYGG